MAGVGRPPERLCVGCRRTAPKAELLRVARSQDGTLAVDVLGTAPGRGAYLHRDAQCVRAATGKGALMRALRAGSPREAAARLRSEIEEVMKGAP